GGMGRQHSGESEWQRGESDVAGEDDDDRSDEHRCRVQGHECRAHRDHGEDEHPQQCPSSPSPDGQAFGDDGEHSCDAGELGDDRHGDDEDEDGSSRLREPHQVLARQTTGDDREDRDHGTMMFHRREVGFHWLSRTPAGYGTPIAARFDREPSSPRSASTGALGLAHERRMPPQPGPQVSGLGHAERQREAVYRLALGDPGSDFALVGPVYAVAVHADRARTVIDPGLVDQPRAVVYPHATRAKQLSTTSTASSGGKASTTAYVRVETMLRWMSRAMNRQTISATMKDVIAHPAQRTCRLSSSQLHRLRTLCAGNAAPSRTVPSRSWSAAAWRDHLGGHRLEPWLLQRTVLPSPPSTS